MEKCTIFGQMCTWFVKQQNISPVYLISRSWCVHGRSGGAARDQRADSSSPGVRTAQEDGAAERAGGGSGGRDTGCLLAQRAGRHVPHSGHGRYGGSFLSLWQVLWHVPLSGSSRYCAIFLNLVSGHGRYCAIFLSQWQVLWHAPLACHGR